ncbi:hypothetical protein [Caballeronia sp. Lep1P3]|uniref:hypothetical protein n=1 Tax=Caballeronia sp. Lep1P3 TaxID=2878150 RepID=UPI001FD01D6F|nr:hypothetical protein [Caballeronia sp. Lep1P3]
MRLMRGAHRIAGTASPGAAVSSVRGFCAVRATWKKPRSRDRACKNYCFFIQCLHLCEKRLIRRYSAFYGRAKAFSHKPQTPFIIAKDDSWKKARKARLE